MKTYCWAMGVLAWGCLMMTGCDRESMNTNPYEQPLAVGVRKLLATDSCGCKVYEIERSDCFVYVNNRGGIAVLPKKDGE